MYRRLTRSLSILIATVVILSPIGADALQRVVPPRDKLPTLQTPAPTGRIVVKFTAQSGLKLGDSGLVSRDQQTRIRWQALVARVAPGATTQRHFRQPAAQLDALRRAAEQRSGRAVPDLNLYAVLTPAVPAGDQAALLRIVKELAADPAVETAFLEPVAVPAALGFDAFTGATPDSRSQAGSGSSGQTGSLASEWSRTGYAKSDVTTPPAFSLASTTPDFTSLQGYLGPAPDGIEALATAAQPGATGATVQVIDVEGAWLWTHEDLTAPFVTFGAQVDLLSWRNHGTAVLGEIRGTDNEFGVRGIVPDCAVGASSVADQSTAEAIVNAAGALNPGDIILIELHGPGPNANGEGQFGYVPMEFWQDNFDAIYLATAAGVIVCEAAGNGEQNLDDPVYQGLFDRSVRNSGAIMCGATAGSTLDPATFSNNGSRVDLSGWGWDVTTCGYGGLQGDPDFPEEQWYTDGFSGTSSASPIVVGAVASLQGMVEAAYGISLDASLAAHILSETGTPTNGPTAVGPRPNLVQAWALASSGIGLLAGTVTAVDSGLPVVDALVTVNDASGYASFTRTAGDGSYSLPLLVGSFAVEFTSFFYETALGGATINSGITTVLDMSLVPRPTVELAGRVISRTGDPLADVRVTPRGVPISGTSTDGAGWFSLTGVPQDYDYQIMFDGLPGYGADYQTVSTFAPGGPTVTIGEELVTTEFDFEANDGFFTADNGVWSWGIPAAGGPEGSGFSGSRCWGVGMTGNYEDDVTGTLTSPVFSYGYTPAPSILYLSFHYWSDTEGGFDGVHLEVQNLSAGTGWESRVPLEGYSDVSLGGIGYQGGWSGQTGGWRGTVFDLTDLIGPEFQFRLVFGSDVAINAPGFWIDDIAFDTGNVIVAVGDEGERPPLPAVNLSAYPNPFNPQTTIAWEISALGPLSIEVFDLRGQKVRTLLDEPVTSTLGHVVWNGRGDSGRAAASGVYLVRLRDAAGQVARLRVSLVQ